MRAVSHAIGTASTLYLRDIPIDPFCQHYNEEQEAPNHVLFKCAQAFESWNTLQPNPFWNYIISDNIEDNIKWLCTDTTTIPLSLSQITSLFWIL